MNLKELNGKPFTLWLTDEGDESANPEDKSLSPDGKRCDAYIRGLLRRRPIEAMRPFGFVGKEDDECSLVHFAHLLSCEIEPLMKKRSNGCQSSMVWNR